MRVAVLHDLVVEGDSPDARDVLDQAEAVGKALSRAGHEVFHRACTLDLAGLVAELEALKVDLVFNLVESLAGHGRLIHLVPFCLDAMGLAYTGAPAEAVCLTSHKILAKERMRAAGIATPDWVAGTALGEVDGEAGTWIVKSVWEHASIGLDAGSLVSGALPEEVRTLLCDRAPALGGACFGERFIDGREFNLSLLDGADGPQVLAPAEILFEGFAGDRPRIVDYAAKWDAESFAYRHTPRSFEHPAEDQSLLAQLSRIALACWQTFGLRGYARIDFRVDGSGRPWVLEINANPCLASDAGFCAALDRSGISFDRAVTRIVTAAIKRRSVAQG